MKIGFDIKTLSSVARDDSYIPRHQNPKPKFPTASMGSLPGCNNALSSSSGWDRGVPQTYYQALAYWHEKRKGLGNYYQNDPIPSEGLFAIGSTSPPGSFPGTTVYTLCSRNHVGFLDSLPQRGLPGYSLEVPWSSSGCCIEIANRT